MAPAADRTGVMVVRIWIEGSGDSIRARLTETLDIAAGEETSRVVASEEEVVDGVRRWVHAFATQSRRSPDDTSDAATSSDNAVASPDNTSSDKHSG
jgi:hypothetical protein